MTSCSVTSCFVTSCSVTSCSVTSCFVTSCSVTSCFVTPCSVTSCSVTSCFVTSCSVTSCSVTSCSVTSCFVTSCSVTSCFVTSCSVTPCADRSRHDNVLLRACHFAVLPFWWATGKKICLQCWGPSSDLTSHHQLTRAYLCWVYRCCTMAISARNGSSCFRIFFAVCTALSNSPLLCGKYRLDVVCPNPYVSAKTRNLSEEN